MNYNQSVEYIHSLLKFGINPGLERMEILLKLLDNPHKKTKFVHVAGTNGKGSCCNMISNVLIDSGKKVGLFTSPYVVDFCERIQINGKMISHNDLTKQVEKIIPILEELKKSNIQPTEFEVITAIAFDYFALCECDVVVLEVGLGGLLDSTNIIDDSLLSVLMPISYDHMNILGNSIKEIAIQKAGIIKQNSTVVSYPNQHEIALGVIMEECSNKNATLIIPNKNAINILNETINGSSFSYDNEEFSVKMVGQHQIINAVTVIEACKQISFVSAQNMKNGIAKTVVPARMELLDGNPMVLLDGGHNEACAKALESVVKNHFAGKKLIGLIGMMDDKEYDKYLSLVAPYFNSIVATVPNNPRSLTACELKKCANLYCKNVVAENSLETSVGIAMELMEDADVLVVCGSFYLASEVRNILKTKYFN